MKKKKPVFTGKLRIRRGDTVVVLAGKDRGAKGKVLRVLPGAGRLVVEGVNMVKKATRPNPQKNIKGGIVEKEAPISLSNVLVADPDTGKATRIGVKVEGGERVRYAKKSQATISAVSSGSGE